jgi:uncharacterized protein (DUF433 family)/DNA-binding transcriptional MerR regulator
MGSNGSSWKPRGRYLAREAGWLAGVSGDKIGQWARRGYIRSSWSGIPPRIYSFQDVAEAIVVHELLDRHARHEDIRRAIQNLRTKYGDWPLSAADLWTTSMNVTGAKTGRESIVLKEGGLPLDISRGTGGQQFIEPTLGDLVRIQGLLHRGGWAILLVPDVESIEVNPDRLSGRPTIKGTRISAERVADLARNRDGLRVLRTDYGLHKRQIDDAVRWMDAVQELEAAA